MSVLLTTWIALSSFAYADRYVGDDTKGSLKFDMVASLHDVPGEATSFTSELTLDDNVTGKLVIQGGGMKTGIGVRDKRMYSFCLETDKFPVIEFVIRGATGDIDGLKSKSGTGTVNLHGQLKIRSTTREVQVPAQYTWNGEDLSLKGDTEIKWSDYGVPDPSIVISTLFPEIKLTFDLNMSKGF